MGGEDHTSEVYKVTDYRRGQPVRVFMGGSWSRGEYIRAERDSWLIQLPKRIVRVYDERSIRPIKSGTKGNRTAE